MLEKLIINFRERIKNEVPLLIEGICLSNNEGLLWKEQYVSLNCRNIYSHSKSFTSLMVGIAIDEGLLSLNTHLVDLFKDEMTDKSFENFKDVTVKDLLMMSSVINEALLMGNERRKGIGYPDYLSFLLNNHVFLHK